VYLGGGKVGDILHLLVPDPRGGEVPQEHESLVRFVYANLGIEDPDITLQKVREVLSRTLPSGRRPVPDRHPIEIRNLAEVREAISVCAKHERSLTEGLVRGLHLMLMRGVPEVPGDPLKPGKFRGPADEHRFAGFKYLKKHRSLPWRIRSDLNALLEDTENGKLASDWGSAAGRFFYRFVRIHPFCDGNGRMARALSTLLLARDHSEVLNFEKPIDEVILEHREDYIGVLEYCDAIYEDLRDEDIPEEEKLRWTERPFSDFYARAFLNAYREHNEKQPVYDLSLEAIKASHSWDETLKKAIVSGDYGET
jgi:hypothetical protein